MRRLIPTFVLALVSCASPSRIERATSALPEIEVAFDGDSASSGGIFSTSVGYPLSGSYILPAENTGETWVEFDVLIPETGTYRMEIVCVFAQGSLWVEDLSDPTGSGRHGITGPIEVDHSTIAVSGQFEPPYSPACTVSLRAGTHRMRLHADAPEFLVHGVRFSLEESSGLRTPIVSGH